MSRVARAVGAARAVAAAHGLRTDDVRVLHDGANVVVDLAPAPVVARVATLTGRIRPDVRVPFGREVALATALTAAGAAVVPPSDLLPPGVHEHDGTVLSFWRRVDVLPDRPTAQDAGRALADLHEVLADLPAPATPPLDTPLDDLAAFAARGGEWGVPTDQLDALARRLDRLRPRLVGANRALQAIRTPATCWPPPTAGSGATSRTPPPDRSSGTSPACAAPAGSTAARRSTPSRVLRRTTSSLRGWSCGGCTPPSGGSSSTPSTRSSGSTAEPGWPRP